MASPEISILDVGHGNCAIVFDGDEVTILDVAEGYVPLELLRERGVTRVRRVLISHADDDHHSGLITLLMARDIHIEEVFVNPDSRKSTEGWKQLRIALHDAQRRSRATKVWPSLTKDCTYEDDACRYEVLAPDGAAMAMSGVGGEDLDGRRLHSNSMSAVVRLWCGDVPLAMFCGDIDGVGLSNMLRDFPAPTARVLVFPHHGGFPRLGDPRSFAATLAAAVSPEVVVFSLGRGSHNPQPEIVAGIRDGAPQAYIVCTQLSGRCSAALPAEEPGHLLSVPAKGRRTRACCGGSLHLSVSDGEVVFLPVRTEHAAFIDTIAKLSAICRRTAAPN